MSRSFKLKKGFDINLKGKARQVIGEVAAPETYAIKPTDFHGLVPKMLVKAGDVVKAGTPVFRDKYNERIVWVAPVSGELIEIKRGARRKILEVIIKADAEVAYEELGSANPEEMSREDIVSKMLEGGVWPLLQQRPFSVVPDPDATPKAVVVSALDTAPLAADLNFVMSGSEEAFRCGIKVLSKLTKKVYVNRGKRSKAVSYSPDAKVSYQDEYGNTHEVDYKYLTNAPDWHPAKKELDKIKVSETASGDLYSNLPEAEINVFEGEHPAGNPGIQIHHLDPINKGESVWVIRPQEVAIIGRLFMDGKYDARKMIAVAGSEVKNPQYYNIILGANIKNFLQNNLMEADTAPRVISGNVLTGDHIAQDGFIGSMHNLITVIPEGTNTEFLGWMIPTYKRPSLSPMFWSTIQRMLGVEVEFRANTNSHGEERPFVVTGQYEKVLPMDIHPVQLLKSCMVEDIEAMEGLGIYEVDPEDMALCEFVCTSKVEVQKTLREGLDLVMKEC